MTISAKIVCDSIGPNGVRLTTYVLTYPRFIHSEFMTHRMFSRNASSSRAIPFEKQVKMIEEDPAMPIEFRVNQKGMQAGKPLELTDQYKAKEIWLQACDEAIGQAKQLATLGVHKQYVNRLLEPYAHITVVVSGTEFANFFALRHHHMAQPEIQELAKKMWEAYNTQQPTPIAAGQWHLPFVSLEEQNHHFYTYARSGMTEPTFEHGWLPLIKASVARCARVSYLNHEGKNPTQEEDFKLYDRLLGNAPIHASPSEHQAQAMQFDPHIMKWSANFRGWIQYRQTLKGQNITVFNGPLEEVNNVEGSK